MLTMRITGGRYCGRKVIIPEGNLEIRPAMDRMRESLFSIIGPMEGIAFCDLFSGSGCVGLEAASRGAKTVHLVELDRAKREIMEKNISWALEDCDIKIFFSNVLKYIPRCKTVYDIVYADPPFPMSGKPNILELVQRRGMVVPEGQFIVHIPAAEESQWPQSYRDLVLTDTRKYGRNMVKFYTRIKQYPEKSDTEC